MTNDSAAHIIYAINGINTEQYTGCSAKISHLVKRIQNQAYA